LVAVENPPAGERGVDLHHGIGTQAHFHAYATDLASILGHADRIRPFED
jgi:acetoin utilization deacetylase AcuC-like enzyme